MAGQQNEPARLTAALACDCRAGKQAEGVSAPRLQKRRDTQILMGTHTTLTCWQIILKQSLAKGQSTLLSCRLAENHPLPCWLQNTDSMLVAHTTGLEAHAGPWSQISPKACPQILSLK